MDVIEPKFLWGSHLGVPNHQPVSSMPLSLEYDPATSLCELRVEGTLKRSEFASCEQELAKHISAGAQPRVLVILDHFGDWEKNEDWDNLDFMFSHGEKIAKIAIVGAGG